MSDTTDTTDLATRLAAVELELRRRISGSARPAPPETVLDLDAYTIAQFCAVTASAGRRITS